METVPPKVRAVIEPLQALRGVAQVSAGGGSRTDQSLRGFARARQLMGYSGAVSARALQRGAHPARGDQ